MYKYQTQIELGTPTKFVPIKLESKGSVSESIIETVDQSFKITVGKCAVEVTSGFNESTLKDIIRVLISLC